MLVDVLIPLSFLDNIFIRKSDRLGNGDERGSLNKNSIFLIQKYYCRVQFIAPMTMFE